MSKNKHGLDQFYTKPDVVQKCLQTLNLDTYEIIVEPSAGEGVFLNFAEHQNKIGYDIEPKSENIEKCDFLSKDLNFLKNHKVLFFGNPPFGRNSSLALKFIKKSSEFAHTIAFILPKGFKKRSMIDKIPLDFKIVKIMDLEHDNFTYNGNDYNVPCIWMVLEKTDKKRAKEEKLKPSKFQFVTKDSANLAIRRVGVNAGNAFLNTNVSVQSHYFISCENPFLLSTRLTKDLFSHNDTTGPRSISKNELICVIDSLSY